MPDKPHGRVIIQEILSQCSRKGCNGGEYLHHIHLEVDNPNF